MEQLAQLDRASYDRARKTAANELGIRVSVLDALVAERRAAEPPSGGTVFRPPQPWPEPVDGKQLLEELWQTFADHIIMPRTACAAAALWVLHAHAHDAATHSPMLGFSGPTKRVGKTTAMRLLSRLVPVPLPSANLTSSSAFRVIEKYKPTLLIDEADAFVSEKSDLRSILDSGHERLFAYALRCVGDDHEPKQFSTWAPKSIAFIGRLHPTLEDRMLKLELRRKGPNETIKRMSPEPNAFDVLCRQCARWARDNLEMLRAARPQMPKELNDRARDNWRPLFAIAEVAGGDWPEEAWQAALTLSTVDDDESWGVMLLADLRTLFVREAADGGKNLASAEMVRALAEMEDRPWPEFRQGKSITPHQLARLLKPFKIRPKSVRCAHGVASGYAPEQFADAWKRYLAKGAF